MLEKFIKSLIVATNKDKIKWYCCREDEWFCVIGIDKTFYDVSVVYPFIKIRNNENRMLMYSFYKSDGMEELMKEINEQVIRQDPEEGFIERMTLEINKRSVKIIKPKE